MLESIKVSTGLGMIVDMILLLILIIDYIELKLKPLE